MTDFNANQRVGNKWMEKSAITIQRIFRGYRIRRRDVQERPQTIADIFVNAQHKSKLQALQERRVRYHQTLLHRLSELQHGESSLEQAHRDKSHTEQVIEKAKRGGKGTLYIDAKLLDGTVVRMEMHQLLVYQTSEIEKVAAYIASLRKQIADLETNNPVVFESAVRIQSQLRSFICRKQKHSEMKRRRRRQLHLFRSMEQCYARMNLNYLAHQKQQWHRGSIVIAGFFRIIMAKNTLLHLQRDRASTTIANLHRHKKLRTEAKKKLERLKKKREARQLRHQRLRRFQKKSFRAWVTFTRAEQVRNAEIARRIENGHEVWLASHARRLQRFYRRSVQYRNEHRVAVLDRIHPVILRNMEAIHSKHTATETTKREQFALFYQAIVQEMYTWSSPPFAIVDFAKRHKLQLDQVKLDSIWNWLLQKQSECSSGWFIDVSPPYTMRTLAFLEELSTYFNQKDLQLQQLDHIWQHFEMLSVIRKYLGMLYERGFVRYAEASTLSGNSRPKVAEVLRRANNHDDLNAVYSVLDPANTAFTSFHCQWSDLCEQCLAMLCEQDHLHACKECGHHRYANSTVSVPGYALEMTSGVQQSTWIDARERCDFIVLNAFFHALAPRGHIYRELHHPEALWKVAVAKAYTPVTILYEEYGITTLDDLLNLVGTDRFNSWEKFFPASALVKLERMLQLLRGQIVEMHDWLLANCR